MVRGQSVIGVSCRIDFAFAFGGISHIADSIDEIHDVEGGQVIGEDAGDGSGNKGLLVRGQSVKGGLGGGGLGGKVAFVRWADG